MSRKCHGEALCAEAISPVPARGDRHGRVASRTSNPHGYFLQLDIRNFFNSIHRPTLFALIQRRLRQGVRRGRLSADEAVGLREVTHRILRQDVGAEAVPIGRPEALARVPPHKRLANAAPDCGLPIGNLTSQFFANVYLNELDQFVKHELKCRYYLRYVDDFVLLAPDRAQLLEWQARIEEFLGERLGLRLHPRRVLKPVGDGADFLGYIVRPHYLLVRRRVVGNLKERLAAFQRRLLGGSPRMGQRLRLDGATCAQLRAVMASYLGHFRHAACGGLLRAIFARHPWLRLLFRLHRRRLIPLWEPLGVSGYRGQVRFFRRQYPNAEVRVQRGTVEDRFAPSLGGTAGVGDESPLAQRVALAIVTEQGYLRGGLRRRRVHTLILQPGVNLCAV